MRTTTRTALSLFLPAAIALAGCSPQIPDSGASAPPPAPQADAASTAAAVLGVPSPGATQPAGTNAPPLTAMGADAATAGVPATGTTGTGTGTGSAAISDEQSFAAVSARETIASDAQRVDQNRAQYVTIEPTELPPRPDGTGASIVAYALATTNVPGQALYRRSGIAIEARNERNCAKYPSSDQAQEAFLDAGGPKRDRFSLDPDGDGFACSWDPRPFRAARGGAPEIVDQYEVIETPGES